MSERMDDDRIRTILECPTGTERNLCNEALRRGEEAEHRKARAEAAERERDEAVDQRDEAASLLHDIVKPRPGLALHVVMEKARTFLRSFDTPEREGELAERERGEAVRLLRHVLDTLRHTSVRLGMLDVGANEVDLVAGRIDDFLRSLSTPQPTPRTMAQTCAEESVPAGSRDDAADEAFARRYERAERRPILTAESVARVLEQASRGFDAALDSAGETEDSAKVLRGLRGASVKAARALREEGEREGRHESE